MSRQKQPKSLGTYSDSIGYLVEHGFAYVDKTAFVREILKEDGGAFFLARPRGFGKSLVADTVRQALAGKRKLFRGLAIDDPELGYAWNPHRVLHLYMSSYGYRFEGLDENICETLQKIGKSKRGRDIEQDARTGPGRACGFPLRRHGSGERLGRREEWLPSGRSHRRVRPSPH
ncbi:MAG: AAA family ATPase [Deltaproteobacteria bacterium]|jgi:hypothetical protein|nr:AAA family ATPase [Deltaproteobacteria bacterium]